MRLPEIRRGETQKLGRHDIYAPGRTANAMAGALQKVGNVAKTWHDAETNMEYQKAKSQASAELSESTNELMRKDFVSYEDARRAGVSFDEKDVQTIQNEDGSTSRFIGSQHVMQQMYDSKAKEIYERIYGGMKFDKGKQQFENFYRDIDTNAGLKVNNTAYGYRQTALLTDGINTANTFMAGVTFDNIEETRASIDELLMQMNLDGIIGEDKYLQLRNSYSANLETAVLNRAIAEEDYSGLVDIRRRAEAATPEMLAAAGLTQDDRSQIIAKSEGARLSLQKEYQGRVDAKITQAYADDDFMKVQTLIESYPTDYPEEIGAKLHSLEVAKENSFYNKIMQRGDIDEITHTMAMVLDDDLYEGERNLSGRLELYGQLDRRLDKAEGDLKTANKERYTKNEHGIITRMKQEGEFFSEAQLEFMHQFDFLDLAGWERATNMQRDLLSGAANDGANREKALAEIDLGANKFGNKEVGKILDEEAYAMTNGFTENMPDAVSHFAGAKTAELPPYIQNIMNNKARDIGNSELEMTEADVREFWDMYSAGIQTNRPAMERSLDGKTIELGDLIDQRMRAGIRYLPHHVEDTRVPVRDEGDNTVELVDQPHLATEAAITETLTGIIKDWQARQNMSPDQIAAKERKYNKIQTDVQTDEEALGERIAADPQMAGGGWLAAVFDSVGLGGDTPTFANGVEARDGILEDFTTAVKDALMVDNTTEKQAWDAAYEKINSVWGVSYAGDTPTAMRLPPEKRFPGLSSQEAQDDLYNWARLQGWDAGNGFDVNILARHDTGETGNYDVWIYNEQTDQRFLATNNGIPTPWTPNFEAIQQRRSLAVPIQTELNTAKEAAAKLKSERRDYYNNREDKQRLSREDHRHLTELRKQILEAEDEVERVQGIFDKNAKASSLGTTPEAMDHGEQMEQEAWERSNPGKHLKNKAKAEAYEKDGKDSMLDWDAMLRSIVGD